MKKYLIVFGFLFLAPSLAFASWWNPFSWSQKSAPVTSPVTTVQPTTPIPVKHNEISPSKNIQKNIPKKPAVKNNIVVIPPAIIKNEIPVQNNPVITQPQNIVTPSAPTPIPQQDSLLKISQCQAKRDLTYNTFTGKVNLIQGQALESMKQQKQKAIDDNLSTCLGSGGGYNSGMTPEANTKSMNDWQTLCQNNANKLKDVPDPRIEKLKETVDSSLVQERSVVDSDYLKCISQ